MNIRRLSFLAIAVCLLAACGDNSKAKTAGGAGSEAGAGVSASDAGGNGAGASGGSSGAAWTASAANVDTSDWLVPPPFYAGGDEPYWRLDLSDGYFVFRRSGLPEIEAPIVSPTSRDRSQLFDSPPLKLTVREGACAADSGQGDASVTVVFDEAEYEGCIFRGQAVSVADAAPILEALGVVDACLARQNEPAVVTAAYPREGDDGPLTALVLELRSGGQVECAAGSDGKIAFSDPLEPNAVESWMNGRVRFLRLGNAVVPSCDGVEPVGDGGQPAGHLLPEDCSF